MGFDGFEADGVNVMAVFPKIQSPCPYKANLAAVMDGDQCRMCKRQVVDLTAMSDAQRTAFLQTCGESGVGEVCVSYRLPLVLAAAVAVAGAALPMAAAAQSAPAAPEITEMVVVGGIKDLKKVEYVRVADGPPAAELPVVYEDKAPAPAKPPKGDRPAAPAARTGS